MLHQSFFFKSRSLPYILIFCQLFLSMTHSKWLIKDDFGASPVQIKWQWTLLIHIVEGVKGGWGGFSGSVKSLKGVLWLDKRIIGQLQCSWSLPQCSDNWWSADLLVMIWTRLSQKLVSSSEHKNRTYKIRLFSTKTDRAKCGHPRTWKYSRSTINWRSIIFQWFTAI